VAKNLKPKGLVTKRSRPTPSPGATTYRWVDKRAGRTDLVRQLLYKAFPGWGDSPTPRLGSWESGENVRGHPPCRRPDVLAKLLCPSEQFAGECRLRDRGSPPPLRTWLN